MSDFDKVVKGLEDKIEKEESYIDKDGKKVKVLGHTQSGKRIIPYKDWQRHVGKKGVQDRVAKWLDKKGGK